MVKRKTKATTVRFHDKQLQRVYEEAREAFQRAGITLEDVLEALQSMGRPVLKGFNSGIVKVREEIRIPAKRALDRMLEVPRD